MTPSGGVEDALSPVLARARERGWIGPTPLPQQLAHALEFGVAAGNVPAGPAVDLGTGGGLPGLALALTDDREWTLVESSAVRARHLRQAVDELGLADRVGVAHERAELFARGTPPRASIALVTARSLGPPAMVAECAAPLLMVGGVLVVSDPPVQRDRWPADGLAQLGLGPATACQVGGAHFARMVALSLADDRYPRRAGVPGRRPLF